MVARVSDVFVGRARELGALEHALDATRAASGATVLVTGEAGIGKTRLASELARCAQEAGFEVLLGRSIDLVGTELPYQPFVDALRPIGDPWQFAERTVGSQLQVFEQTLALITERAASAPVLLVLEDLHWADISTLDLVVFLAHNLDDRRVLVLVTCRDDEPSSAERVRRLADGVRRSGSAVVLGLGPLEHEELAALLAARADAPLLPALSDAIVARSEGNPFFAEELLAAASDGSGVLPRGLRELLLQRVARLDRTTQGLLRLAAAAGREVDYRLLRAAAPLPEYEALESLRQAVEHGVLVADQETGSFRFRHTLLAQAIYTTILPGEREELHARLADQLVTAGATAAELAPHWAAAGRATEALSASVEAAGEAEAVFGLAEARGHLERALALWESVPDAARLVGVDLAELCSRAAELAGQTGAAPRAVELARRAIELVGGSDPLRAARLHENLGVYLDASGRTDACLAVFERAVELVPERPPSAERAQALAALGSGLMLAWRHDESLAVCVQALALARAVRAQGAELRGAHDARNRPRLPRPRRRGPGTSLAGPAARRGEQRPGGAATSVCPAHRRTHDARSSPRVSMARRIGARGDSPLRHRHNRAGRQLRRGAARDRRMGPSRQGERRRTAGHQREPPTHASHPPRPPRARPRRLRCRTRAPRSGASHRAPRGRLGDLQRLRRRARPVGAPVDGRR